MKKTFLTLLVAAMGVASAFAQLSTGEPNASVLPRTGNRPQAGDFGMYLGASVTQVMDLVEMNKDDAFGDNIFWALPVVNIKYYMTDNWEFRLGFEFAAKATTEKDAAKDSKYGSYKESTNVNFTRFLPGFAYHFNTNNILDVYVGAQVPLGFNLNNESSTDVYDGKKYTNKFSQGAFVIGGGVFLGLQVFVADLPFAIGIEGGYSGHAKFENKGMTTINDNGSKYKYIGRVEGYHELEDYIEGKSSSYMEGTWGADAAITFTYYFRK
ncbi:MAG: PorT family protein [Paludibacteraceae bacterium]|nr:PorT family protein [Paludibacteraceae bacterium]